MARRSDSFRRISTLRREKLTSALFKSRRDLHSLIKIIQNLLSNSERDPCDLTFKTMSRSQIFYNGELNTARVQGRRATIKVGLIPQITSDLFLLFAFFAYRDGGTNLS